MRSIKTIALTVLVVLSFGVAGAAAATPSVRVARDYACALAEAGTVSCWGANNYSQLGNGALTDSAKPVAVKDVANAVQLDIGLYGGCVLIADGTVKCWGYDTYGALGTGGPATETGTATTIVGIAGATKISVGEATICAIVSSPVGTLKCWGYGSAGQLGSLPATSTPTPQTAALGGPATDVSVGEFHACAVVAGALKCWGSNNYRQILDTATLQYNTPQSVPALTSGVALSSAGDGHTCAVMLSGAIKCWGANAYGQDGTGLTGSSTTPQNSLITSGATSISYGAGHRCAQIGDSARCWGWNSRGQIGDGTTVDRPSPVTPTGLASGVSSIDTGGENTCAIVNKVVKCWGDNASGGLGSGSSNNHNLPVAVAGISGATDVDISNGHACAVVGAQLQCWGRNSIGELGTGTNGGLFTSPTAASTFGGGQTAVAVSRSTTCSIASGAVKCAGYGWFGQLGNNTDQNSTPTAVSATVLTSATGKIYGGSDTFCAIPTSGANSGKVYCWGANDVSMLGQGAGQDQATLPSLKQPTAVVGITGGASSATSMDLSYTHACAVVAGALKCWGQNYGGAVTGTSASGQFPVIQTPGLSGVSTSLARAVATGYSTTCAIVTSPAGGIKCFGEGNLGTLGNGVYSNSYTPVDVQGITGATAIAANTSAFCAVVSGAVKCWGRNEVGQLGNGTNFGTNTPIAVPGISNAVSVSGQFDSFCALLADGGVKCWGEGYGGQLGAGGSLFASTPTDVAGLSVFTPPPSIPTPPYVKQKIKPSFKLNGKIKKTGSKIKVPLKLSYAAPAGSSPATVCGGTTTISVKLSKKKTAKFKATFKTKGANCSYTGTIKLPKSFKGKKTKFAISMPGNADVLAYRSTKTLKLK